MSAMHDRAWWCLALCAALTTAGCTSPPSARLHVDAFVALGDASARGDAHLYVLGDAGPVVATDASVGDDAAVDDDDAGEPVVGPMDPVDAGSTAPVDPGPGPDPVDPGSTTDPAFEVEMTYVTANIGRDYDTRAQVVTVFDRVADVIGGRSGPRFIGWQEIGEEDPCGSCEVEELPARFSADRGWETRRPLGTRPDGGSERVKVPVTTRGAGGSTSVRAVFASPGWAGVSPTRFVTVAYYAERNVSLINTHFIAGAWSCRSEVARRRDYWRRAWTTLQEEVAREHDRGRNVVVTGDLNRARATSSCNPDWDPTSLHARARIIGGTGIDYVFAVAAPGWTFTLSRRADGTMEEGTIHLGIDSHAAHWVAGRFRAP
jgi:hypothetical protein